MGCECRRKPTRGPGIYSGPRERPRDTLETQLEEVMVKRLLLNEVRISIFKVMTVARPGVIPPTELIHGTAEHLAFILSKKSLRPDSSLFKLLLSRSLW